MTEVPDDEDIDLPQRFMVPFLRMVRTVVAQEDKLSDVNHLLVTERAKQQELYRMLDERERKVKSLNKEISDRDDLIAELVRQRTEVLSNNDQLLTVNLSLQTQLGRARADLVEHEKNMEHALSHLAELEGHLATKAAPYTAEQWQRLSARILVRDEQIAQLRDEVETLKQLLDTHHGAP